MGSGDGEEAPAQGTGVLMLETAPCSIDIVTLHYIAKALPGGEVAFVGTIVTAVSGPGTIGCGG